MKKSTAFVAMGVLAVGAWWYCGSDECNKSESLDSAVGVLDQVWIDTVPLRDTDKVNVFALLSDAQFGVFNESSAYEGSFSLFGFEHNRGKLALTMLQTGTTHKVSYKISTKGCGDFFDYCLKIKGAPRGPKVYGTLREWVIDDKGSNIKGLQTLVQSLDFDTEK